MTSKSKIKDIEVILNQLFPTVECPLQHSNPYTLLIAVLLSAQCTDERVNEITPNLFSRADNPYSMIKLTVEEIKNIIKSCGLANTKARAIHRLSEILIKKHHGEVPKKIELLEELPGVGHKTASVVVCQAFGIPAFPVDTHIHRLATRWGLSSGSSVKETEDKLKKIFARKNWNKLHLQIIFYGRKYCPARGHIKENCPICKKYAD